jgi:hypothetical protein
MRQLARHLQRLAYPGAFVDLHRRVNRVLHEAALRQIVPASLTHERQVEAMVRQVCQAMRAVMDPVVDKPPRFGLDAAWSEGCRREARRRGAQG